MNQVRMKNEKIRQTLKIVCWNSLNEKKIRHSLLNRSAENCQKYGILLTGKSEADLR